MSDDELFTEKALAPLAAQRTDSLLLVFDKADELQRQIMAVLYDRQDDGDTDPALIAFCEAHDTDNPALA